MLWIVCFWSNLTEKQFLKIFLMMQSSHLIMLSKLLSHLDRKTAKKSQQRIWSEFLQYIFKYLSGYLYFFLFDEDIMRQQQTQVKPSVGAGVCQDRNHGPIVSCCTPNGVDTVSSIKALFLFFTKEHKHAANALPAALVSTPSLGRNPLHVRFPFRPKK